MAPPAIALPRYAVDSNVLIDLAMGKVFAQRLLAKLRLRQHGIAAPPAVIGELFHIASEMSHPANAHAIEALSKIQRWGIETYSLISVGPEIVEINAHKLLGAGLLPEGEVHDAVIIIETALRYIPILITSDIHLLGINPAKLSSMLDDFDLIPVTISHPMAMLP
jgi:predicted nucleic acid-binding protein